MRARRLDEAIAYYREGLALRPDDPALLTNLSEALRRRGIERYDAAVKVQDRRAAEAANKDWLEAADASRKAVSILSEPAGNPRQQKTYARARPQALLIHARDMLFVATKVDHAQSITAWEASQEYLRGETNSVKKAVFRGLALQMLFDAGNIDMAIAESQKVLRSEPQDLMAHRVLGLSLFASGNKANYAAAAYHLQRYLDRAPNSDPLKQTTKASLSYLKDLEKISTRESQRPAPQRP